MKRLRERFPEPEPELPLKDGGGGGMLPPMDPWQTSVETRLGQVHGSLERLGDKLDSNATSLSGKIDSNFRWLLGAYGIGMATVFGALIASYLLLADKIAALPH